jgi:hypothetical protein
VVVGGRRALACVRGALAAALLLAIAQPALAQDAEPFGSAGQWVLEGSAGFRTSRVERDEAGSDIRSAYWWSPGVLWFVADHFALGAALQVGQSSEQITARGQQVRVRDKTWGGALRIGHHHALSDQVSVFPRYALGYFELSRVIEAESEGAFAAAFDRYQFVSLRNLAGGGSEWTISAFVPLLWHPARHVFLGGGPMLAFEYGGTLEREFAFSLGLCTTIGGWID